MDEGEQRLAQNEALFREVNEQVEAIAAVHGDDEHVTSSCECSNADCTLQVRATLAAYEAVGPSRGASSSPSMAGRSRQVVAKSDDWWVIEKQATPAGSSSTSTPRSRPARQAAGLGEGRLLATPRRPPTAS